MSREYEVGCTIERGKTVWSQRSSLNLVFGGKLVQVVRLAPPFLLDQPNLTGAEFGLSFPTMMPLRTTRTSTVAAEAKGAIVQADGESRRVKLFTLGGFGLEELANLHGKGGRARRTSLIGTSETGGSVIAG